ncbi:Holliday junction branch migration DNA helicase RuvB [Cytobacillus sp. S13-E01]|uniref:Holliday junction branch migration DNA helicase RuvB n=1 Tax=Cytobacillus sp. S13-E01 TaxID=3031326 RepID=UPI0023D8C12D|nr:Holliday junction branch migration DNA helicase RuvB [Cytobacillus sp. S13-E01]MDF0728931.1 Holliday junction branch migration DNA helicase RuvB [Cytobacillus sp. S13-E01]
MKRPLKLNDYVGQEKIKKQLSITIGASKKKQTQLPHMLFYGNPGLGKTTLAKIIANEFGVKFHEAMGTNLKTVEDVESVLANLTDDGSDVLFIDEIHRLPLKIEELFYPVMEDFVFEKELNRKIQQFWVPEFTLIGATTLAGELSRPLRDRFNLKFQLQNYNLEQISDIILKLASREKVTITDEALYDIAKRSKGVARIGINYFYRCLEYAEFITGKKQINQEVTKNQFEIMEIDDMGLDEGDRKVLLYLANQSSAIGGDALAIGSDIDKPTLQNIIEPYLIQCDLIIRTNKGREITNKGKNWIGNFMEQ